MSDDETYESQLQPFVLPFNIDKIDYTTTFDFFQRDEDGLQVAVVSGGYVAWNIAHMLGDYSFSAITALQAAGRVKLNGSNGLVVANWDEEDLSKLADRPSQLFRIAVGWGPDFRHYVNNACGKIVGAAAFGVNSLEIVETDPGRFRPGMFPYGGAAYADGVLSGLSSLTQTEDHDQAVGNSAFVATVNRRVRAGAVL